MVWRGEALDVPVTAGAGVCELQHFLGCESPLGWVVHYLSLLQGSQEAHLSPFPSALETPLNDTSYALFLPQNLYCAGISLSGDSNPRKYLSVSILPEKSGQIPQVCPSFTHLPTRDPGPAAWPGLVRMLRTRGRLCFQS